jgi:hypothetical protein
MSIYSHGQFNLIQYPDTSVHNYFSDQFTVQLKIMWPLPAHPFGWAKRCYAIYWVKIDHEHIVFLTSLPAEFASRDHFLRTRSGVLRGVMCYVNLKSDYEDTGFWQDTWLNSDHVTTSCAPVRVHWEVLCDILISSTYQYFLYWSKLPQYPICGLKMPLGLNLTAYLSPSPFGYLFSALSAHQLGLSWSNNSVFSCMSPSH